MVLDYSKWDNLDDSSGDEGSRQTAKRQPHAESPPATAPTPPQRRDEEADDENDAHGFDAIPCPEALGPQIRAIWPRLSRDKRLALLEQFLNDGDDSADVAYHPSKSLHKDLFDPEQWRRWLRPELLAVIDGWHEHKEAGGSAKDFSTVDMDAFEGCRVEAPGIVSFPSFTDEFADLLLEEVRHYRAEGMPSRAPNSMNNYGLVLNEIGLRPMFQALVENMCRPLGAKLFGNDSDRVATIGGVPVEGENWGGSSLDDHHTFVVQYQPENDKHLDMHIDECDVTFNFGITQSDNFAGNDLTFCGMFDQENHRRFHHDYKHVRGRGVVHSGKRRHGALDITSGERISLIMWTKSQSYRRTQEYMRRNRAGLRHGPADRVCLSYTHDPDYKTITPKKLQYLMKPKREGEVATDAMSAASTQLPRTEKRWVRVCAAEEVEEGGARVLALESDNEQVAVFRHRGELFAMDSRCAHMGGPLCEGNIEDLGTHHRKTGGEPLEGSRKDDGVVRCPRHGMCFNIRTGQNVKGGRMQQRVYPLRLIGEGDVEVELELEVEPSDAKAKSCEDQPVLMLAWWRSPVALAAAALAAAVAAVAVRRILK